MKCPHCNEGIHEYRKEVEIAADIEGWWVAAYQWCPECRKLIINLEKWQKYTVHGYTEIFRDKKNKLSTQLVRPIGAQRPKAPKEVPTDIANDYNEACLVLPFSAKASAALSRRCLQHLLRKVVKIEKKNLSLEIDEVMKHLPSHLAESIDAIRNIGNFSAHPIKSNHTGEIFSIEPGEAEWNLEVLEELFDHYCVKPARVKEKREALDKKLSKAGKPKMKGTKKRGN